jgi:hypothetical protein
LRKINKEIGGNWFSKNFGLEGIVIYPYPQARITVGSLPISLSGSLPAQFKINASVRINKVFDDFTVGFVFACPIA